MHISISVKDFRKNLCPCKNRFLDLDIVIDGWRIGSDGIAFPI